MYRNSENYGARKWPDVPEIGCGPRLRLGVDATPFEQACGLTRLQNTLYGRVSRLDECGKLDAAIKLMERVERIDADLRLLGLVHDVDVAAVRQHVYRENCWEHIGQYELAAAKAGLPESEGN